MGHILASPYGRHFTRQAIVYKKKILIKVKNMKYFIDINFVIKH